MAGPVRRRGVRRPALLLLAAVLVLPWVARDAAAAPAQDPDDITMTAVAGVSGRLQAGRPLGVVVDLASTRAISGVLRLTTSFDAQVREVPVELAAGTTRQLVLAAIAPPFDPGPGAFRLQLKTGDGVTVRADPLAQLSPDPVVGVLGSLAVGAPDTVVLDRTDAPVRLAAIDADRLSDPGWLGPLSVIVTQQGDLARLGEAARGQLLDWLNGGGQLVVDDATTEVPSLPAEWQPGASGRARAGLGAVVVGGGTLAAGGWSQLEPGIASVSADFGMSGRFQGFESASISAARDAGLRAASVTAPLLVVIGYAVLIGPVAYLLLRRRRRTDLLWVVIPVVAVAVTAAVLVTTSSNRTTTRLAHVAVVETGPEWASVHAVIGATTPGGGEVTYEVPAGAVAAVGTQTNFGFEDVGRSSAIGDRGASRLLLDVPAGGFSSARITGPVDVGGARLTVDARAEGDTIIAEVTNDTPWSLAEVALFSGRQRAVRLGAELAPGESAEVELERAGPGFDPFLPSAERVWPGSVGWNGPPDVDGPVAYSILGDRAGILGHAGDPAGVVTAVGWTRAPEIPAGSGEGRTAVVGRAPVRADGYTPAATQVDVVHIGSPAQGPEIPLVVRVIPSAPPQAGSDLFLSIPGGTTAASVRAADGWRDLVLHGPVGDPFDPSSARTLAVPVDACPGGVCYVRLHTMFEAIAEQLFTIEAVEAA